MLSTRLGKIIESVLIVIFIIVIGVLMRSFYDNYNSLAKLKEEEMELGKLIDKENKGIGHLKSQINLQNSTIEQKARELYMMQKDNETIIIFKK